MKMVCDYFFESAVEYVGDLTIIWVWMIKTNCRGFVRALRRGLRG